MMARGRYGDYDDYNGWPPYVRVADRRKKAEKKFQQLKKKNPHIKPVIIEGQFIATTWWGKSWNKNLESYADYSNRIERGRSYVRHRAIMDLQIKPGEVRALVQGSSAKPYSVTVQIDEITPTTWKKIKKESAGKLDSLPELLAGKFPKAIGDLFTQKGKGLFPSPRQIRFSCSCPDWAVMCKHVAATLYGIGARLDEEPALFFTLRKVEINDLVSQVVQSKSRELLKKAKKKSTRIIEDADLSDVFGIRLDESPGSSWELPAVVAKKTTAEPKKSSPKTKKSKPKQSRVSPERVTGKNADPVVAMVYDIIRNSEEGADTIELRHTTGLDTKQIHVIIAKLKKKGKIENLGRGIYIASSGHSGQG